VMSSFVPLISGFFHQLFRFLSYMRVQSS
jgi:hypothetical protein